MATLQGGGARLSPLTRQRVNGEAPRPAPFAPSPSAIRRRSSRFATTADRCHPVRRAPIAISAAINDVSTDLNSPPRFTSAPVGDLPGAFKDEIRRAYPDVVTQRFSAGKSTVFDAAAAVAKRTPGWTVTKEDGRSGVLEGTAVTPLLRFTDDWAVRVSGGWGGVKVDMRSRSRVGQSDFGTNARRIKEFMAALRGEVE